jgi:hypothetical protein
MENEEFEGLEEPIKQTKERMIGFRVDERTYLSIESVAEERGKKTNEWARELVVCEAAKEVPMTAIERLLFEEIARLRFIVGNALKLVAVAEVGELTSESWLEVLAEADQNSDKIAQQLLAKRRSFNSRSVQGEAKEARA